MNKYKVIHTMCPPEIVYAKEFKVSDGFVIFYDTQDKIIYAINKEFIEAVRGDE